MSASARPGRRAIGRKGPAGGGGRLQRREGGADKNKEITRKFLLLLGESTKRCGIPLDLRSNMSRLASSLVSRFSRTVEGVRPDLHVPRLDVLLLDAGFATTFL